MRIVSANIFCLNVRPAQAIAAVAAQKPDVAVLIESTPRFERHTAAMLPPVRAAGLTRRRGMPVSIHASEAMHVEDVHEHHRGWFECRVQGVMLLAVHAIAPYLPWRLPKRRQQLAALADRLCSFEAEDHAIALGDFNTSHFEPVWTHLTKGAADWKRLDPLTDRWRGTWPLGGVWAPIAVDHALCPPHLSGALGAAATVRTFRIPGSDHMGLIVDLPGDVVSLPRPNGPIAGRLDTAPSRETR